MKKLLSIALLLLFALSLGACQNNETIYKVGASPTPHAEILAHVQPILAEQGYTFEVVEFTDYVLPNSALESGDIIANYFQHVPYLNAQIEEYGYDFVNVGGVHVEPIGLYTKLYDSISELPNELEIVISNSPTDRPRLLGVLEENSLITINNDVSSDDIVNATVTNLPTLFTSDYTITFKEVAAELLFANYNNEEGDAVLINGNYALDNGLNPLDDSIALEGSASQYVNIVVATSENADNEFVLALVAALQSEEVQQWIEDNYGGAVVPAA
ncbi:MAG: methionine ABC transporter substrate-binding protein [Bacilli bacterium]|nr:methionine ABC transporter substrate-binding protein [Bacilli bacterium]MBN2876153.1 methionine ABC transporter substrate-binding protein [Bacilli bacterium]